MKLEFSWQTSEIYSNIKLHENPSSESPRVPRRRQMDERMDGWMNGQTDRQTDKHDEAKSCLHSFVNTPKSSNSNLIQLLGKSKESGNNIFFSCTM